MAFSVPRCKILASNAAFLQLLTAWSNGSCDPKSVMNFQSKDLLFPYSKLQRAVPGLHDARPTVRGPNRILGVADFRLVSLTQKIFVDKPDTVPMAFKPSFVKIRTAS